MARKVFALCFLHTQEALSRERRGLKNMSKMNDVVVVCVVVVLALRRTAKVCAKIFIHCMYEFGVWTIINYNNHA